MAKTLDAVREREREREFSLNQLSSYNHVLNKLEKIEHVKEYKGHTVYKNRYIACPFCVKK